MDHELEINGNDHLIDFILCTIDATRYAFEARYIDQIHPYQEITYVPGCYPHLLGVIQIRGEILSVISLHPLLEANTHVKGSNSRILLARFPSLRTGFLVDSVEDFCSIPNNDIGPVLHSLSLSVQALSSGSFSYRNETIIILEGEKVAKKLLQKEESFDHE